MFKDNDTKCVMVFSAVICLLLVFLMFNSFKIIDGFYFIFVVGFTAKYLLLSKN